MSDLGFEEEEITQAMLALGIAPHGSSLFSLFCPRSAHKTITTKFGGSRKAGAWPQLFVSLDADGDGNITAEEVRGAGSDP